MCRERWQHTASLRAEVRSLFAKTPVDPETFMPERYRSARPAPPGDGGAAGMSEREKVAIMGRMLKAKRV